MNLRKRLLELAAAIAMLLAAGAVVAESDFETGAAAYHRGDYAEAFSVFERLAELGDAKAQTILGLMYSYGESVPVNHHEALQWYQRAGDQGYNVAQYRLGMLYVQGKGTAPNRAEAIRWFSLAAAGGHPRANEKLAELNASVHERPRDTERSTLNWAHSATASQAIRAVTEADPPASKASPKKQPQPSPIETGAAYRVQLAASRSKAGMRRDWSRYKKQYGAAFKGLDGTIERAQIGDDKTVWYRLRVGPLPSEAAARALCKDIKQRGMKTGCLLVRPDP